MRVHLRYIAQRQYLLDAAHTRLLALLLSASHQTSARRHRGGSIASFKEAERHFVMGRQGSRGRDQKSSAQGEAHAVCSVEDAGWTRDELLESWEIYTAHTYISVRGSEATTAAKAAIPTLEELSSHPRIKGHCYTDGRRQMMAVASRGDLIAVAIMASRCSERGAADTMVTGSAASLARPLCQSTHYTQPSCNAQACRIRLYFCQHRQIFVMTGNVIGLFGVAQSLTRTSFESFVPHLHQ